MNQNALDLYGQHVRVRVCGICWRNGKMLMVNHAGLGPDNFWSPPGGGLEITQTASDALVREFAEEAGIVIKAGSFKFACEFIKTPWHAIELFFEVHYRSGDIIIGTDPEMQEHAQIIQDVRWMTPAEIKNLPQSEIHGIFKICTEPADLLKLSGYWPI